jgi:hypothetical protein
MTLSYVGTGFARTGFMEQVSPPTTSAAQSRSHRPACQPLLHPLGLTATAILTPPRCTAASRVWEGHFASRDVERQALITTKFVPARKDAAAGAKRSQYRLDTDYVDLYLAHWSRDLSPPRFEST